MAFLLRLKTYFAISALDPAVMISQINAFSKQVPLLYVIGNVNAIAVAYTHYATAPKFLTLMVPIPIFLICVARTIVWYQARNQVFTAESARARLRVTVVFTGILGGVYAGWALCLYPYGDAYARCHVAFFMSTTVIGTIFCLMHLRTAALLLTAVVSIPFLIRFLTTGEPVLTAMALDFTFVVLTMIVILLIYYRDFTNLVHSQTTLVALSDENFRIANLDSLTELPNRRRFFTDFARILVERESTGTVFALGLIDLDGFKPVNDVYGHAAGDRVLMEVGQRLRQILRPSDIVARLGGDEFGLLLALTPDAPGLSARGAEICRVIQQSIALPNGTARVSASIGFTVTSSEAASEAQLIERADYALFRAKAKHRGTAVIFSTLHENAIQIQSLIEQELRRADFRSEMTMKFQPIVDVPLGKVVAYEALARWVSPLLGAIGPMDFIGAAERTGLINQLTMALFAKALAAAKTWADDDVDLSFNLSVCDIASSDLVPGVQALIAASGVPATRIVFEITETALMNDFDQARDRLLGLKALGARIAIDDFGTGYSSLHYVHRLPLDKIKIDRGFVADIETNKASRDIVKSIVDLCRNLDITCIVEGVETAEQMKILQTLGCATMQGYYFGRPADNETLDAGAIVTRGDMSRALESAVL